jgi:Zn-dependent peptidase ImmA (M78 family)/transcriptional regulator with XRE-family HTH domain
VEFNILATIDLQELGRRLQRARKQKGLTQLAAAAAINTARTTITAIEKGERRIKADELIKLAQAYGCQVSDFVRTRPDMASFAIQFHNANPRGEVNDEQIVEYIEQLEDLCRDYLELEEITGAKPFRNYPSEYRFDDLNVSLAAEMVAQQERSRLGLGDAPIHALRELLERDVGLRIFCIEMKPAHQYSAMYVYDENLGGAIAVNGLQSEEQRRFALAHAYAHFLAHRQRAEILVEDGNKRQPVSEQFADRFAAHLLLPTYGVTRSYNAIKASQPTFMLGDLLILASYYGVSLEAMATRLQEIRLLSSGVLTNIQHRGVNIREAKAEYGLAQPSGYEALLPRRYQRLAVQAYNQGDISEGQLAKFLRVNRLQARESVALLQEETNGLQEWQPHDLHAAGADQES